MSATETRINIEDPDSLGLSPDEEDKILRTDDTQDTNMATTSGANPPAPLAEVELLSSAILSLTERLDKLEETSSTKGKGKDKGKGNAPARNLKAEFPPKNPPRDALAPRASKMPLTLRIAKLSWKKLPKRVTRVILKARMKYYRRCRRNTRLRILLAKIHRTLNFPSSLVKCSAIACRIKS